MTIILQQVKNIYLLQCLSVYFQKTLRGRSPGDWGWGRREGHSRWSGIELRMRLGIGFGGERLEYLWLAFLVP